MLKTGTAPGQRRVRDPQPWDGHGVREGAQGGTPPEGWTIWGRWAVDSSGCWEEGSSSVQGALCSQDHDAWRQRKGRVTEPKDCHLCSRSLTVHAVSFSTSDHKLCGGSETFHSL